ncbi:MAG: hypothetical protein C0596_01055 [Marinilabiliales bacterium]|nr:MAG: hypothetical protein C0596_01055 [Marinilabiliales bacterium]
MRRFVYLLFLVLFCSNLFAQSNVLSITKESSGREKIFNEGTKIRVFTNDGISYKGKFVIVDENTISIGSDTLVLSNIDNIRIKNIWGILGGSAIIGAGGFISYTGFNLFFTSFSQGDIAILVSTIVGIPIGITGITIASGGVLLLIWNRNYEDVEWEYSIK